MLWVSNVISLAMRQAAEDRAHRSALLGMNAWERHKHFLANVVHYYGRGSGAAAADANPTVKTDFDILQENYRCERALIRASQWLSSPRVDILCTC